MAEHDEKPWWRQMYGLPPTRELPAPDTRNGRFARAILRHPARYGWGLGAFMAICWTASFRFAMDADTSTAVLLGLASREVVEVARWSPRLGGPSRDPW